MGGLKMAVMTVYNMKAKAGDRTCSNMTEKLLYLLRAAEKQLIGSPKKYGGQNL
jgi:hypothetical protein